MTPVRDPKRHFCKPLGKHVGAIWEGFGNYLGGIWELEAEEAFFLPDRTTWIRSTEGHTRLNTSCSHVSAWMAWGRSTTNIYTITKVNTKKRNSITTTVCRSLSALYHEHKNGWFSDKIVKCKQITENMTMAALLMLITMTSRGHSSSHNKGSKGTELHMTLCWNNQLSIFDCLLCGHRWIVITHISKKGSCKN